MAGRLRLDGVRVALGGHTILEDTDLAVEGGERIAVLGASGCGKTTLLRLAGGLIRPTGGTVTSDFLRPGFVFQDPRLLPWRTALDNAALGGLRDCGDMAAARDRAAPVLDAFGLAPLDMGKRPDQLSGGMRARVALARVLLHGPDLLLCDEPFGALDIGTRHALHGLLARYLDARAATVLLITHDVLEAVSLCDRVLVMARQGGAIAADLRPADLVKDADTPARAAAVLAHPTVYPALTPAA